jgi:hypothetical protein
LYAIKSISKLITFLSLLWLVRLTQLQKQQVQGK